MLRYELEAQLTNKVRDWLSIQPDIAWYKASDRYHKGVSDFVLCCNGIFVAAELKADDGEATQHQKDFIAKVIKAGGIGGVCFTLKEVKDLVEQARKRNAR